MLRVYLIGNYYDDTSAYLQPQQPLGVLFPLTFRFDTLWCIPDAGQTRRVQSIIKKWLHLSDTYQRLFSIGSNKLPSKSTCRSPNYNNWPTNSVHVQQTWLRSIRDQIKHLDSAIKMWTHLFVCAGNLLSQNRIQNVFGWPHYTCGYRSRGHYCIRNRYDSNITTTPLNKHKLQSKE